MMRTTRMTSTAILSLVLWVPALAAQGLPSDPVVQQIIQDRVDAGGAVGIAVGLLDSDGTTRTFVAGSAGEGTRALSSRTLFEIGSITKVFTGTVLADMARRGELSVDDPVVGFLPDGVSMPERAGAQITLADLSTHHSGLPRLPGNMMPADPSNPYVDYTADMMYEFLSGYTLPRDIGAQFEYSNLAVGLLGHVLARRAGMGYEALVRERILDPLGMDMTGIELSPEMQAEMAKGHDPSGQIVPLWDVATLAGAGGLRSNIDDMMRFMAANVGEATSDVELSLRDAHAVREDLGNGGSIGLNWITRTTGDQRIVWHNGGTAGFRTFAGFDPDEGTAVVVLTNSGVGADDIGFHLLNQEIPLAPPQPPETATREAVEVDVSILAEYVGEYQLAPEVIATFVLEDGQLFTQLTGQPRFPLFASSDTEFFLRVVDATMTFERDDSGEVTQVTLRQAGQTIPARRIR